MHIVTDILANPNRTIAISGERWIPSHELLPELTRNLSRTARENLLGQQERMNEYDRNGKLVQLVK